MGGGAGEPGAGAGCVRRRLRCRLRPGGIAVLVYSAGHGTLLARSDRVPLTWSVGWAELTAVPGGVWVWTPGGHAGVVSITPPRLCWS